MCLQQTEITAMVQKKMGLQTLMAATVQDKWVYVKTLVMSMVQNKCIYSRH